MREFELNQRKVNPDGSRNIFCKQCGEFIVAISTAEVFNSALCLICQRAQAGLPPLPDHVYKMLRSRKIGPNTYLPLSIADQPLVDDPLTGIPQGPEIDDDKPTAHRMQYWVKVVTREGFKQVRNVVQEAKKLVSKQISNEKKRKRVFDQPIDKDE